MDRKTKTNVGVFNFPENFAEMTEEEQFKVAADILMQITGAKGVEDDSDDSSS